MLSDNGFSIKICLFFSIQFFITSKWFFVEHVISTASLLLISNSRKYNHNQYISQKAKDAIVDQFREKYGRYLTQTVTMVCTETLV